MKSWIKNSLYLTAFITIGYGISRLCETQTKGFRKADITSAFPFDSRWALDPTLSSEDSSEIQKALTTPFRFVATGGSAYVFRSEDDQYVIKFFQAERLCPPWWSYSKFVRFFIPSLCSQVFEKKQSQKMLQFSSYKLSFESLQKQTGVVYTHLNPTSHLKTPITFYDNLGIKHTVSADQTAFVLQKKATSRFVTYFKKQLAEGNTQEASRLLSDFAYFMKERAEKGIRDGDITPRFNVGMLGKSLIIFDIDQLRTNNLEPTKLEHMMKDSNEMFLWLEKKSPELLLFFKEELLRLSKE